jgi:RNA polymerase sigma factor (sigma-70 family)
MMRRTVEPGETGAEADDEALVREARLGGAGSYDALYLRHRDRVARTAYVLLGNADLAQDVAQEAFLVGWRDLRRLRDPSLFRAWITGIAVNLCRRRRRERRGVVFEHEEASEAGPGESERADLRIVVRRALDGLPPGMRDTVVLRFYCQFSEREIGAALGVPVGTVKSRLTRARARLAASLGPVVEEA